MKDCVLANKSLITDGNDPWFYISHPVEGSTLWITTNCGKFLKKWQCLSTLPISWEICMHFKKQCLELDMEQLTGSKLGKEYNKAVYCHHSYLIHMQSTSARKVASVLSNSLWPYELQTTTLLCPWDYPSKNTGVGCPPPGDVPNPGIEPESPALQLDSSPAELPGKPNYHHRVS